MRTLTYTQIVASKLFLIFPLTKIWMLTFGLTAKRYTIVFNWNINNWHVYVSFENFHGNKKSKNKTP